MPVSQNNDIISGDYPIIWNYLGEKEGPKTGKYLPNRQSSTVLPKDHPKLTKHRKTRSILITAHVEEHILEALKEDAHKRRITVSALINSMLGLYYKKAD